jgi:hypothetical protein
MGGIASKALAGWPAVARLLRSHALLAAVTALATVATTVPLLWPSGSAAGAGAAAAVLADAPVDAAAPHIHGSQPAAGPPRPLDARTRARLGVQLDQAQAAALRYPTAADAVRAGYRLGVGYERQLGTHYFRFASIDDRFDPRDPEMLLYSGDELGARLVGATYYVVGSPLEPAGFAGGNDRWHQHLATCVNRDGVHVEPGDTFAAGCPRRGRNAWMLHVWVVPGYESPGGVFSVYNIRLP